MASIVIVICIADTKFKKYDNVQKPGEICFESLYSRNHYITWSCYPDLSIKIKVSLMHTINVYGYNIIIQAYTEMIMSLANQKQK